MFHISFVTRGLRATKTTGNIENSHYRYNVSSVSAFTVSNGGRVGRYELNN